MLIGDLSSYVCSSYLQPIGMTATGLEQRDREIRCARGDDGLWGAQPIDVAQQLPLEIDRFGGAFLNEDAARQSAFQIVREPQSRVDHPGGNIQLRRRPAHTPADRALPVGGGQSVTEPCRDSDCASGYTSWAPIAI